MNLLNRLALSCASCYLRYSPVVYGRWRLVRRFLPLLREEGASLGEKLIRTRYGFLYRADLGDWLGQFVYLTGLYEPPTARVIARLLEPGQTMIDVGANSGFFTLLGAVGVGSHGRVHSFEPVPSMRRRLLDNLEINGITHVHVHAVALSDREGEVPLFEGPVGHKGISSLRPVEGSETTIRVHAAPLDALRDQIGRIDFVKIDVEGAEHLVVDGMTRILAEDRPYLVVEMTDAYLRAFGRGAVDLAQHLMDLGYRMYAILPEGLKPMAPIHAADDKQFNALFAPDAVPADLLAPSSRE